MTTVYDPFGFAEFAVEIRDGETLIGRTEPSRNADDAKRALAKLTYAYQDSRTVWRPDPVVEWIEIDKGGLDRLAYQRTAAIVAFLIGEGPARVNWSLSSSRPNRVEGHCVTDGDPREALQAYADLLGGTVTESPHLEDRVKLTAEGTYHGLAVEVWDLVTREAEQDAEVSA